jgi:hypothetical protein
LFGVVPEYEEEAPRAEEQDAGAENKVVNLHEER